MFFCTVEEATLWIMKSVLLCLLVLLSGFATHGQSIKEVLSRKWSSIEKVEDASDPLLVEQFIDSMVVDTMNNYVAFGKTMMTQNGIQRVSNYGISGRVTINTRKKRVTLTYNEE